MINENQNLEYRRGNVFNVLLGTLIGGLAGAATMLLFAPQSGEDTRLQIQKKGIELRNLTSEMVGDTMSQLRSNAKKVTISGREKMKELKQQEGLRSGGEYRAPDKKAFHGRSRTFSRSLRLAPVRQRPGIIALPSSGRSKRGNTLLKATSRCPWRIRAAQAGAAQAGLGSGCGRLCKRPCHRKRERNFHDHGFCPNARQTHARQGTGAAHRANSGG